jgi:hypothetical protein
VLFLFASFLSLKALHSGFFDPSTGL